MSLFTRSFCHLKSGSKSIYNIRHNSFTFIAHIKRFSEQKHVHNPIESNHHRYLSTINSKLLSAPSESLPQNSKKIHKLEYLICLDFEATCWSERDLNSAEIIEFGAVLVNLKNQQVVSEFHEYVRPTQKPILSDYCKDLTGITQEMIDDKEPFPAIYQKFKSWLESIREINQLNYTTPNTTNTHIDCNTTFCTWTNMDLSHYFSLDCGRHDIKYDDYFRVWIDAKRYFRRRYRGRYTFEKARKLLNIPQVGSAHSAIDDAKTLCQMVLTLFHNKEVLFQVRKNQDKAGDCIVLFQHNSSDQNDIHFDYLICLDVEATCWENREPGRSEIIEIGAVLLDVKNDQIVSEFHEFVRPTVNQNLSDFCVSLTNISQEFIEQKEYFPAVYQRFIAWLNTIGDENQLTYATPTLKRVEHGCNTTFCSWTKWDLGFFFRLDCARHGIEENDRLNAWIDARKVFQRTFLDRYTFEEALTFIGVSRSGTAHSAIDDARTLAKMVANLHQYYVKCYKVTDFRNTPFDIVGK